MGHRMPHEEVEARREAKLAQQRRKLTHEQLNDHLAEFFANGGQIEQVPVMCRCPLDAGCSKPGCPRA